MFNERLVPIVQFVFFKIKVKKNRQMCLILGFVFFFLHSLYINSEIKEDYLLLGKDESRYTVFCMFCMIKN